jgi:hypothetical protein
MIADIDSDLKLIFLCTRQKFTDRHIEEVYKLFRQAVDWEFLWSVTHSHGVAPLVYTNLRKIPKKDLGMPDDIDALFADHLYENIARRENSKSDLQTCLTEINRRGIDVMLLKGAALNMDVYETPWYTYSEDVDLLFRKQRTDSLDEDFGAILSLIDGYNKSGLPNREHLEYDFNAHHDVNMNGMLKINFDEIWRNSRRVSFAGQQVCLMSAEDRLLAACVGSCRKRFLRLKSNLDIREITFALGDIDWHLLVDRANKRDYSNIMFTALQVADMTLGIRVPDGVFEQLQLNQIRKRAISRLAGKMQDKKTYLSLGADQGYKIFNRTVNVPLLLTYATYTPGQITRKVIEIVRTRSNVYD